MTMNCQQKWTREYWKGHTPLAPKHMYKLSMLQYFIYEFKDLMRKENENTWMYYHEEVCECSGDQ